MFVEIVCIMLLFAATVDDVFADDGDSDDGSEVESDSDDDEDTELTENTLPGGGGKEDSGGGGGKRSKGKIQHLSKEVKDLKKQVEDMLQEIRNQNQALFKHADHNRILSGKVSEMSKELKSLRRDRSTAEEKLQLMEFKTAKKVKKVKAKMAGLGVRLDLCKCPLANGMSPAVTPANQGVVVGMPGSGGVGSNGGGRVNYGPNGGGGMVAPPSSPVQPTRNVYGNMYAVENDEDGDKEDEDELRELEEQMERKKERKRKRKELKKKRKKEKKKEKKRQRSGTSSSGNNSNNKSWRVQGSNHIFVTGGSSNSTEVVDINSPRSPCPAFAEYPLPNVKGAVGTFIAGRPVVCGGRSSVEDYYDACYGYVVANDSWVKGESMGERRFQATAIMIDSRRWWITGGFSGTHVYNTTEIYQPGKGFTKGPNLPEVTFQHCLVKINATHIFNVGGFPYSNNAWLMDFDSGAWSATKPIGHSRDAPHCAMTERRNGKVEVVVAGGSLPGSEVTTEIFSVTDNRWRQGPRLPQAVIYGVSVSYRNSLLLLGGREMAGELEELDLVYEYDALKETWSQLPTRLDAPRTSFVAILLPDYLHCANNFKPPERINNRRNYYYGRGGGDQRRYGGVNGMAHGSDTMYGGGHQNSYGSVSYVSGDGGSGGGNLQYNSDGTLRVSGDDRYQRRNGGGGSGDGGNSKFNPFGFFTQRRRR